MTVCQIIIFGGLMAGIQSTGPLAHYIDHVVGGDMVFLILRCQDTPDDHGKNCSKSLYVFLEII